jgi:DNA-binding NarL/FixJ family response regulator
MAPPRGKGGRHPGPRTALSFGVGGVGLCLEGGYTVATSERQLSVVPATVEEWQQVRRWLGLSQRQLELIQRLFGGDKLEMVALDMKLGHGTVKTYQQRIYQKLGVSERCQMMIAIADAHLQVNLLPLFRLSAS